MAAWEADWYKDEGGRDKSIPLHIQLLDAKGRLVRDRSLPLKVTLHYEKTYLSVTNQVCVYDERLLSNKHACQL